MSAGSRPQDTTWAALAPACAFIRWCPMLLSPPAERSMSNLPTDLVTGDAGLDAQHAFLLHLLDTAEKSGDATLSPAELSATVKAVMLYTLQHFAQEEAYMQRKGWPLAAKHLLLHQQFKKICEDLLLHGESRRSRISGEIQVPIGGLGVRMTARVVCSTLRNHLRDQILTPGYGDKAFVTWLQAQLT